MHLGALTSLAEVGVGINLAFGIVHNFHTWLRADLQEKINHAALRIEAEVQNMLRSDDPTRPDEKNGELAKLWEAIPRAEELNKRFTAKTTSVLPWFIGAASLAAGLLLAFLAVYAYFGDDSCAEYCFWIVLFLVAVPVTSWFAWLKYYFDCINGELKQITQRCAQEFEAITKFIDLAKADAPTPTKQ